MVADIGELSLLQANEQHPLLDDQVHNDVAPRVTIEATDIPDEDVFV